MIAGGRVTVGGMVAHKSATAVRADAAVVVREAEHGRDWASRGAHKLLGALTAFDGITAAGRRCLDAGASTGGFTDVLLREGAGHVVACDVGRGLLEWRLATDERVTQRERTNVRYLTVEAIGGEVDLVVADLSFISLGLVLPALSGCANAGADMLLMVKPQFEVGKARVGAGGVVRDPALRAEAVRTVAARAERLGWRMRGVVASPLPGPSGNVEYFVWLCRGEPLGEQGIADRVADAVQEGPQ